MEYRFELNTGEETATTTMLIERTADAQHIVMSNEGSATPTGGVDEVEIFVIRQGGETTMYVYDAEDQRWTTVSGVNMDDALAGLPMSPNSFISFPDQGRPVEEVELNGVLTTHYTFSKEDFLGTVPGLDEARGDVWVNEEMNLVMKAEMTVKGVGLSAGKQAVGSYPYICDVTKLNDPSIVITVP